MNPNEGRSFGIGASGDQDHGREGAWRRWQTDMPQRGKKAEGGNKGPTGMARDSNAWQAKKESKDESYEAYGQGPRPDQPTAGESPDATNGRISEAKREKENKPATKSAKLWRGKGTAQAAPQ